MLRFKPICLILFALASLPASAPAVPTTRGAPTLTADLSLQVWALRTLHELDLTPAQLKAFRAAASPDSAKRDAQAKSKVPDKYLAALRSLRDALLKGEDDDQISELRDELETLREDDEIEIDDDITITVGARQKTAELIRSLAPSQVAGYIAVYQDEIPDPISTLMDAADDARGTDDEEFQSILDETADNLTGLLAGLDVEKGKPVTEQVRAWLKRGKDMGDAEFKARRGELETAARQLVGDIGPFTVLHHWLERDIAELLSNPQLVAAIDAKSR